MSRPSFPFYPDNYMNDAGLRRCSKGSRGIWMDLICLMHQGIPYGHLSGAGGAHPVAFLASWCREPAAGIKLALRELEEHGVYGITDLGVIFSRRMVRDEYNRTVRGAGGIKSLDHPKVPRKDTFHSTHEPALRTGVGKEKDFEFVERNKNHDAREIVPVLATDFEPFWVRWCELTKRAVNRGDACRAWLSVVEPDAAASVMACLERYGASGEVARGAVMDCGKWLFAMARDTFSASWPGNVSVNGGGQRAMIEELYNED